jgi:hypothetical protein
MYFFKNTSTLYFLLIVLTVISCKKSIRGEGPLTTRQISVADYTGITLMLPAEVKVVMADSFNCIIRAQHNIADAIKVKRKGDELEIKSEYSLKTDQPIELFISIPVIKRVEVDGSGNVSFVNPAKGEKLRLYVNGSGSISARAEMEEIRSEMNGSGAVALNGSAAEFSCAVNGSGDIHAFNMSTEKTEIEINGSGDAEVNVSSRLRADIRGSGNIIYKGQPHVVSEIIGSGTVKKSE